MKKNWAILSLAVILLSSCSGSDEANTSHSADTKAVLQESQIFEEDAVRSYIQSAPDSLKNDARQVFLKGIDLYRNKKNPSGSIAEFKKSLLLFPQAKTYYELGNAFLDLQKFSDAIAAYHMAEELDYNPISKVLYNLACAHSLNQQPEEGLNYISLAIENGYNNKQHLLTDRDLEAVRKHPDFNSVYQAAMSGASSPEEALFDLFKTGFEKLTLPYSLDAPETQLAALDNPIAYDFEIFVSEMVNPDFSRDVGDEFFYAGSIENNDKFYACIYAGATMMYDTPPVYYVLTTYSPQGKIIDKLELGGMRYYDSPLKGFSVNDNLSITVDHYDRKFEKDPLSYGYKDNQVVKNELVKSETFRISESGKIIADEPRLGLLKK